MAITAPPKPKPKRETWRDWMPDGALEPTDLMTREEFVARLNAVDIDVSEGDLRFWEYHGVLPRAVKRWQGGANRVFYPRWMIATVAELRVLQELGLSLREIGARLKDNAGRAVSSLEVLAEYDEIPNIDTSGRRGDALLKWCGERARYDALKPGLLKLGQNFQSRTGEAVASVAVVFSDADGRTLDSYTVNLGNQSHSCVES